MENAVPIEWYLSLRCWKGSCSYGSGFSYSSGSSTGLAETTSKVAAWIAGKRSGSSVAAAAGASRHRPAASNTADHAARAAATETRFFMRCFSPGYPRQDQRNGRFASIQFAVVHRHFSPALAAAVLGQARGEVHRAVAAAGAAEGDGRVAAGVGAQPRQPGVEETRDLVRIGDHVRLLVQVLAHRL